VTLRRLRVPKNKAGYFGVHLKPGHPKPLPQARVRRGGKELYGLLTSYSVAPLTLEE
jgi:hypothetical protein